MGLLLQNALVQKAVVFGISCLGYVPGDSGTQDPAKTHPAEYSWQPPDGASGLLGWIESGMGSEGGEEGMAEAWSLSPVLNQDLEVEERKSSTCGGRRPRGDCSCWRKVVWRLGEAAKGVGLLSPVLGWLWSASSILDASEVCWETGRMAWLCFKWGVAGTSVQPSGHRAILGRALRGPVCHFSGRSPLSLEPMPLIPVATHSPSPLVPTKF